MTLQRSGDGTGQYVPPSASNFNPDVFGLARPAQLGAGTEPRTAPRVTVQKLDKDGNLYYWRIELLDGRGGLNLQRGKFDKGHDRLASGTVDLGTEQMFLPQLTSTFTDSSMVASNLHWANIYGTLVMGTGNAANHSLFKETSTTDPTPVALTYSPSSSISCMGPIIIASGTNGNKRLAIFRENNAGQILDDVASTPTINATAFHNNTLNIRGFIQVPLSGLPILLMARQGNSLYSLNASDAISTAPSTALSNVPAGGYALGVQSLGGGPIRAWWVFGETLDVSGSYYVLDLTDKGHVTSTNLQGTDPQELNMGLPFIYYATLINGGVAASDGKNIRFHNGRTLTDLQIFSNRPANSNKVLRVAGLSVRGPELIAEINEIASANGTGSTVRWLESYNFDLKCWLPISGSYTPGGSGIRTRSGEGNSGGGLPISDSTGFLHLFTADKVWYRMYRPPFGTSAFSLRKTSGAQSTSGVTFEPSGTATWPAMQIPGLEGWPMAVRRISGNPQLEIGGGTPTTYPSVELEVGGVSATFVYGQEQGRQEFQFFDNENVVYELQPVVTLTQQAGGTDPTRTTPQAFPLIIEGIAARPDFRAGVPIGDFTR